MTEGIKYLGVYGNWVMRFGKELNKEDPLVIRIMEAYKIFLVYTDTDSIAVLMSEIDTYVKEHPEQPLPKGYRES